ncbi:hypothetical protein [Salipiger marinus]|uniref:hypothetical protein n=1 Tax=Salipiger marinus TaxID=555512 RepID=UPI001E29437F|nr:hypothetical protein [Salipiger manganoxidans]
MTAALALDGVTKRFGDTTAITDVSLALGQGEFVALLGPPAVASPPRCASLPGWTGPAKDRC